MKHNLVRRLVSLILVFTMLVVTMPTLSFADSSNGDDIVNVTNGHTFTMRKDHYELVTSNSLYETKDYLAYVFGNEFFVWFFDDLSNVKFSMWSRGTNNFGLYPSTNTTFTQYVYDVNTLGLKRTGKYTIDTSNMYNYSYSFIASFSIYTDQTYSEYFYATKDSPPIIPTQPIVNETNGHTFTMRKNHYELVTSNSLYGTKDYLAYVFGNEFFVWFFDDLSNVKFSMWSRGANNFGLYPSTNTTFTQYAYDANTLKLKRTGKYTIATSNLYAYSYSFIASFSIYTDQTYSEYFYATKKLNTFEPLEEQEAKDFLRFISNSDKSVKIEEKLPEYYNLLIGGIDNPEEEKKVKVSFLAYCYYCLEIQVAKNNEKIEIQKTYFMNWITENTEASEIIFSETKDAIVENLQDTIALGQVLPEIVLNGVEILSDILEYGELLIHTISTIEAIIEVNKIKYLYGYEQLLRARYENNESAIMLAEAYLDALDISEPGIGDRNTIEKYASYIFDIEKSLYM